MVRRGELQEVELLDEHDVPLSSPPPRRRIAPGAVVVGALVVAAGLAATQWVITARERAAVEALAQVPGVLAPVDETITVARTVAGEDAGTLFGHSEGVLDRATDGSQSYTWVDGTGGGSGWTAELMGPSAALAAVASGHVVSGSTCVTDSAPSIDPVPATRVVCLVTDGAFVVDPTSGTGLERLPATTREVVVLSVADGSVLARWPVDAGEYVAVLPDVVVLGSWSATDITLAGYDPLTGEQRWTRAEPLPRGFRLSDDDHLGISLFRVGDLLGYSGPERSLLLLSADGRPVRDLDGELGGMVDAGWLTDQDGRIILQSQSADAPRTTFLAPDGDPAGDVTVDGRLVHTVLDDDSVPGLLLTAHRALCAWDERTGDALWANDEVVSAGSALVMRGRVFVTTANGVVALDARTGALVWATETERRMAVSAIATDAHHLLVMLDPTTRDGEPVLVAYDPASGHEEFRAHYPDGISMVGPARRTLVGMDETTNEYVVLG
ncbi:PQQ-binding-like beta-propeller repeat protein [Cellulomonas sp. Leaf334]|uniref:outer membrane protein assembly factor BamB family protein n=1 Tax=Cellulomonas sp. Leaf334 TaxID=1736339 RepID=UPI0006F3BB73|nr:PQQ-binding-like beta-propeller repeat protein [Cellulomonas sp. Leaf334]KQR17364.1 hypothetical protein ASF78_08760 [Cellulomonas sp. Leaf334]